MKKSINLQKQNREEKRLAKLQEYQILDTPQEAEYDEVVQLAAYMSGADAAAISLIDENRQWFKACVGTGVKEISRASSLCQYVVESGEPLIIDDLHKYKEYDQHPALQISPDLRFYAGFPLTTPDGYHLGTLCVFHNEPITLTIVQINGLATLARQIRDKFELKITVSRLSNANEELEKKNNALAAEKKKALEFANKKGKLLAQLSHELRTPLHGIMGMATLMEETAIDNTAEEYLKNIVASGKFMLDIVNDVLDVSKLDARKVHLLLEPFNLRDSINEVFKSQSFKANNKKIDLQLNISENLNEMYVGDSLKLKQILSNLLSNALKFTEEGFVKINIYGHKQMIRFEVADSGIGIPEHMHKTIFEQYTQGDKTTNSQYGGTGLGTHIVRELTKLMKGNIGLESPANPENIGGKGLRIWADIPLKTYEENKAVTVENKGILPSPHDKSLPHILLAEDDEINQLIIIKMLENLCTLDIANDGSEALSKIENNTYDLILMDTNMPIMSGPEVALIARNKLKLSLPIISLSANIGKEMEEECINSGMQRIISKPFGRENLLNVLSEYIEIAP